jgi:ariadne-1
VYSRSLSINSDDEYNYSDLEEDDEAEYVDDDDGNASVGSSSSAGRRRTGSDLSMEEKPTDSGRLSPLGAGGSAAKKKRMSAGLNHQNAKATDEYRVIDEEELFQELRELIQEIASVLEITPAVAAVLLRHFGWNKEKLFEGYYLDPTKARQDAGVEFADVAPPKLPDDHEVRKSLWFGAVGTKRLTWLLIMAG